MKQFVIAIVLAGAAPAVAAPLPDCPATETVALEAKTAANLRTTYTLAGTDLRVCIDKAVYPYRGSGKGHYLLTCYTVASGGRGGGSKRVCGENATYLDWRGYRIQIWLRTPRFTESSDVWLQIVRSP
jgi:hypothetical protein